MGFFPLNDHVMLLVVRNAVTVLHVYHDQQIGLAVGDIEEVQKEARLKRLATQVRT